MELKATSLVLSTGGSPTKTFALLQELGIGPDTVRPLSYSLQKMNDTVALTAEEAQTFYAAMANPSGALQESMSVKFGILKDMFGGTADDDLTFPEATTPEPESADDLDLGDDIDMFADDTTEHLLSSPENATRLAESVAQLEGDLPWDTSGEDDMDFMDEPSVGADPVSYDRSALEADDSEPELVVDTSPETIDEMDDIFG